MPTIATVRIGNVFARKKGSVFYHGVGFDSFAVHLINWVQKYNVDSSKFHLNKIKSGFRIVWLESEDRHIPSQITIKSTYRHS